MYFPVNIVKFFRTLFYRTPLVAASEFIVADGNIEIRIPLEAKRQKR